MNEWMVIDIETSGVNKYTCDLRLMEQLVFDTDRPYEEGAQVVGAKDLERRLLSKIPKVFHNASFDVFVLRRLGFKVNGPIHDTYLMAKHVCNTLPGFDLKSLSWWYFGDTYHELAAIEAWEREHGLPHGDMTKVPSDMVRRYCAVDVTNTVQLVWKFWPELKDNAAYDIDRQCLEAVLDRDTRGMCVDKKFLQEFIRLGSRRIRDNKRMARRLLGTSKSPTGNVLRDHLTVLGEMERTKTGKVRADKVALRRWKKDAAVRAVGRLRSDEKLVKTYATNLFEAADKKGIVFPQLIQSGAITRRFRAKNFYCRDGRILKGNIQNVPDEMRHAFVARPGYVFGVMDLASIEARVCAAVMEGLIGDSRFAELYRRHDNFNMYLHVMEVCAGEKNPTKKHPLYTPYKHGTLAKLYGESERSFVKQLQDKFALPYTEKELVDIYRSIDQKFPVITVTQRSLSEHIVKQGYLTDHFGDKVFVPREEAYKAVAYYCQECAGNVLKWWWVEVHRALRCGDMVVNSVHDELDLELTTRGAKARLREYADLTRKLDIFDLPIVAEVKGPARSWGECS